MKTHEVTPFWQGTQQGEFYLIADCSTTAGRIPTLFAGGYWARCQLRNGIGYVPAP